MNQYSIDLFFFLVTGFQMQTISRESLSSLLEGDCGFKKSLFKNKCKPASVMYFLHVPLKHILGT